MIQTTPGLMEDIRSRFAHVDHCPYQGPRVFFENAGGALTLKSVIEISAELAGLPDNQGRDNPASHELVRIIQQCKSDTMRFLNAHEGQVIVGESGTELIFRLISAACLGTAEGGDVVGSTLEHPATRSAAARWARIAGKEHILVAHDSATGSVGPEAYAMRVSANTRVATIVHTSPVTGMSVDVAAISALIRQAAPDCLIIVDGIQHASHGLLDVQHYGIDGYVISPYKVFSRHGYGVAWISPRLSTLPHDALIDGPEDQWELGTRDTSAYATFSAVVRYFEWLGSQFTTSTDGRDQIEAAGKAIHQQESALVHTMLHGTGNLPGLADMSEVQVIGGIDNARREGLVALSVDGIDAAALVARLSERGIRVHVRKDDHYSGNILKPLNLPACIRVSMCHYNTEQEVAQFLAAMQEIVA